MWILVDNSVECRGNCGKITLRSLWKTHEIVDNVILISCLLNLKSALESNLALFLTFLLFDFLTISIYIDKSNSYTEIERLKTSINKTIDDLNLYTNNTVNCLIQLYYDNK